MSPLRFAFGSEDVIKTFECGFEQDLSEVEVRLEFQLSPYSEGLLEIALRQTELSLYCTTTGHQVWNIGLGLREGTLSICVWRQVKFQSNFNFR